MTDTITEHTGEVARRALEFAYPNFDSLTVAVGDILVDLMHLCRVFDIEFEDRLEAAWEDYRAEALEPDDIEEGYRSSFGVSDNLAPPAFVFGRDVLGDLLPSGYRSDLNLTEAQIIEALLQSAIAGGFTITVEDEDGEGDVKGSTDLPLIRAEIGTTSQTNLYFHHLDAASSGWVVLIHGNEESVISDYSVKLEAIVKPANDLAEKLEG